MQDSVALDSIVMFKRDRVALDSIVLFVWASVTLDSIVLFVRECRFGHYSPVCVGVSLWIG